MGSNCDDVLIAGRPGSTVRDGDGARDLLQAGPSGDTTLIAHGSGIDNDTFCSVDFGGSSGHGCAVGTTLSNGGASRQTQNVMVGGTGQNFFFTRNGHYDYINGNGGISDAQIDGGGLDTVVGNVTLLQ